MRGTFIPTKRELNMSTIVYRGLSGIEIEVDTAHRDAGRHATLATGERVQVLGYALRNFFNTMAIRLPDGRVTTVARGKLQYEE